MKKEKFIIVYMLKNNIKDVKVITQHVWAFIRFQTLNE